MASPQPQPPSAGPLGPSGEAEWRRLREQAELASGFWLAFVFVPSKQAADELFDRLSGVLAERDQAVERILVTERQQLSRVLPRILASSSANAMWVEVLLPESGEGDANAIAWDTLMLRTNERRDAIRRRVSGGLVFVTHATTKRRIREAAPDLWSRRSIVIDIAPQQEPKPSARLNWRADLPAARVVPSGNPEAALAEAKRRSVSGRDASSAVTAFLRAAAGLLEQSRPLEALGAAQEAVALAESLPAGGLPDLVDALALLARAEAAAGDAPTALEYLERTITLEAARQSDRLVGLLFEDATIALRSGDIDRARNRSARALAVAEDLDASATSVSRQHALFAVLGLDGDVEMAQSNLQQALARYEQSQAIAQQLTDRDPNPEWQRDLAQSFDSIGDARKAQGELPAALAAYEQALAITRRLVSRDPENPAWQQDLARILNNVGQLRQAMGDVAGTRAAGEQARAIGERLSVARQQSKQQVPTVFISSTAEDLREYREAAREAALQAGFYPSMMEYFTSSGARPPLAACLERVDAADLVLVIVAHRYGWIPPDQPGGDTKSVTWLECERAVAAEKEVMPFLADVAESWPADRREEFRLMQAAQEQRLSPALADDVQLALRRLNDFKTWLNARGISAAFRTADDLGRQVASALYQWRDRHPDFDRAEVPRLDDETALAAYRRELVKASQYLPLRGIDVEAADPTSAAARLELAKVYVSLNTTTQVEAEGKQKKRKGGEPRLEREETRPLSALEAIAKNRHVVILGSPGSGKSTLLSHLTFCLSAHQLEPQLDWLSQLEGWPPDEANLVPIVVPLRDFARSVEGRLPNDASRPDQLWNFIEARLEAQNLRGAAALIKDALEAGRALVVLDGLDEISTKRQRVLVRDAVQSFCHRYDRSRHIVTCRTLSYQDPWVRLDRFPAYEVAPFDDQQIAAFIGAWYAELLRLKQIDEHASTTSRERLREAARRGDLVAFARNPLLLTVMALVNTHKGRLPDARALLYEEIVDILLWRWEGRKGDEQVGLRARLREIGRSESDLKRVLWQLAFETHRQGGSAGRDGPADIDEGALLRALMVLHPGQNRDWAWQLVELMKVRAGLLLERAPGIFTFPHRTFQEYLAGAHLSVQVRFLEQCYQLAADTTLWRQAILLAVGRLLHVAGAVELPLSLALELSPPKFDPTTADDVASRRAWLAGEVLDEVGTARLGGSAMGADLAERIPRVLAGLLDWGVLTSVERCALGTTLGKLGDPRFRADAWWLPDDPRLGFVEIAASTFTMGSDKKDKDSYEDEQPAHRVELPRYFIAKFPVTVAQFRAFVEPDVGGFTLGDPDALRGVANHPVTFVSWHDAVKYCRWLTGKLRASDDTPEPLKTLLRVGDGGGPWQVMLASEAEWEKAARGTNGRRYPWGDEPPDVNRANYAETGIGGPSAVGCFPRGVTPGDGIADLAGNVWEWTRSHWSKNFQDPYVPDPRGVARENLKAPNEVLRVVRGGAFDLNPRYVRAAYRFGLNPVGRGSFVGFRVVVSPFFSDL